MMRRSPFLVALMVVSLAAAVSWAQEKAAEAAKPAPLTPVRTAAPPAPRRLAEIKLAELESNQRVKLVLDSGLSFSGIIEQLSKDTVTLNLSFEKLGLLGSITFNRATIKRAFSLPPISEARVKFALTKRLAARNKAGQIHRSWLTARREKEELEKVMEVSRALLAEARKAEEELAAQKALLEEFPESEGWGPERLTEIHQRRQALNQAPTTQERRFMEVFGDWLKAKAMVEVTKEREAAERRELLLRFPPAQGWSSEKLAELQARESAGGELSSEEAEFKEKYADWETALKESQPEKAPEATAPAPPAP